MTRIGSIARRDALRLVPASLLASACLRGSGTAFAQSPAGALTVGTAAAPVTLDPAWYVDEVNGRVTHQIFETLISHREGSLTPAPGLARAWEVSPDGLAYTFQLQVGVVFHDGSPFDASAVKWNFDRWMDPANRFHKETLAAGGDPFSYFQSGGGKNIRSVDVVAGNSVRITLTRAHAPLLMDLTGWALAMNSPKSAERGLPDFSSKPVGTGPFRFAEGTGDRTRIVLERNPSYWGRPAHLSRVIVRVIPDADARFQAIRSGDIDVMMDVRAGDIRSARDDQSLVVLPRPPVGIAFLNVNCLAAPYDQVAVRQALAASIDRDALVERFYAGNARTARQTVADVMLGSNAAVAGPRYDPDRARELLAEAGYPDGFATELWYPDVPRPYLPDPSATAEAIAADLGQIGVTAALKTENWTSFLRNRSQLRYPLWLLGLLPLAADPDGLLSLMFGDAATDDSWQNTEVRELLARARAEAVAADREAAYHQVASLVEQDVPRIPLVHCSPPVLARSHVTGFIPGPLGSESLASVSLAR